MNSRAHQLGLIDTHYMNPHGLSETGNYSSARDLAVLGRFSLSIPLIHQISETQTYIIPQNGSHPVHALLNGNQFLWWYPGVDGGKTGYDGGSNFVQVISCIRNHHHLIGVVIHTNNWWTDMRDLMNWGFDNFKWISPRDLDSQQNPIPFDSDWNYFASDKQDNTIDTADQGRYYIYTGFSISGPILAYFDKSGGLKQFGYPIGMPTVSTTSVESQHFEHATIQCDLTKKQCTAT
jgi:D-alanyl-D-alanine carboxypeptidase